MLEWVSARHAGDDKVMVHARHNGVPVHFHMTREAIEDFLRLQEGGMDACLAELCAHWPRFTPRLEALLGRHGDRDFLVTSELFNP